MAALDFGKQQGYVDAKCVPYEGKGPEEVECNADKMRNCARQFIDDYCVVEGEEEIKKEIKNNGPVVGIIPVYRDFLAYKDGIYEVQEGVSRFDSGQAVKVFGWGEENGRNYWLVENYWGETWGERGVVRIYGGQEDMYLDSFALSIRPKYIQPVSEPYHTQNEDEDIPVERQCNQPPVFPFLIFFGLI
jgi:cathepsin B